MRKPITYLNFALVVVVVWMVSGIQATWSRNHARYAAFARTLPSQGTNSGNAGGTPAPGGAGVSPAFSFPEIVTRNVFTPDRNNDAPPAAAVLERRPAPPLPVVIGTLNLGSGMVALMSEKTSPAGTFRRIREGDEFAGYKVTEIAEHKVVLDFEGQKKTIDVYASADTVPGAPPPPVTPAPSGSQIVSIAPPAPQTPAPAPGQPLQQPSGDVYRTDDPQVTYVIEGNRKRFTRRTPFGPMTWYEPLAPGQKQ